MAKEIVKAVALALGYVDGLRTAGTTPAEAEAEALLEYLAGQGFVVRPRDGAERVRLKPEPLDQRRTSGAEIRAMRMALDLSVTRLATQAGINHGTLTRIESGQTSPQAGTLAAILDALAASRAVAADRRR